LFIAHVECALISHFHCKVDQTAFFWVIMQRVVVISYWRFRTTYWSHLQGSSL